MQNAKSVGLNKDHIGIATFDHVDDPDFTRVAGLLSDMADAAPSKTEETWERYERHQGV
jgi:hypothetical protein